MIRFVLYVMLFSFLGQHAAAQKLKSKYFAGLWTGIDSSSGEKFALNFLDNKSLLFLPSDTSTWRYKLKKQDSIIILKASQKIRGRENGLPRVVVLEWEFVIIRQNQNCFWMFDPGDYEKFLRGRLQENYFISKLLFESWLKEARSVYYRTL